MTEAFYRDDKAALYVGNCLDVLTTLPSESVQTCVTSPPFWGLRDYGNANQIGMESSPDAFVAALVSVFRAVRRVLRKDGTLWLNLGDSFSSGGRTTQTVPTLRTAGHDEASGKQAYLQGLAVRPPVVEGIGPKQLIGIPWRCALALQADGWVLRSDIIWAKPNPMPSSVRDRPTVSHEHLFLLAKSPKYYYDADAISEPCVFNKGSGNGFVRPERIKFGGRGQTDQWEAGPDKRRNKRDVWTIPVRGYKGAHFATFPPALITPCVLAGSRPGDTVLDPFAGSGTTLAVASEHGRKSIGIELNPAYADLVVQRLQPTASKQRGAA